MSKLNFVLWVSLVLSSCATQDAWTPRIYVVKDGALVRGMQKFQCDSSKAEAFVCMPETDMNHLYSACYEEHAKPWWKFW